MTVRPNGVANRFKGIGLKFRLREEAREKAGENVAAPPLGKIGITAGIDEKFPAVATDQGVITLEDDPTVAVFGGNLAESSDAILLHHACFRAEQARGFARVRSEHAAGVEWGGARLDPIERGSIYDDRDRRALPLLVHKLFPIASKIGMSETGTDQ